MVFLLAFAFGFAQRPVTGRVVDANGAPMAGVTVTVKETNVATQTDAQGNFSINAAAGNTLVFSYLGQQKEQLLRDEQTLNISFGTQTQQLSEVVVTALGVRREKRGLGYSVEDVKGEQLTRANNQNVVNSLNGRVTGVQVVSSGGAPGQASRIVIRGGAKSLTGNNEPLFVIDGIPISNANDGSGTATEVEGVATPNRIADINPEDIESMTILKGSAAAVLYGNRGANGVVLITTKSGRGARGGPVITFSSNVGFENPLKLPDFQRTFAQGAGGEYIEGGSRSFGPRIQGQKVFSNRGTGDSVILTAFDPRKDFLQTGATFTHNLSVAQARDNTNYFLSLGHSKQNSIVPNQDYNKASLRFNVNNQITSKLSTGLNLNYVRTWGDVPYLGQDANNPFFALFNMPISWNVKGYGYVRPDGTQINFRSGFDNPLWTANKTFFNTTNDRIIGAINFVYKVLPWMDVTYRLGVDQLNDDRKSFRDIFSGSNPNGMVSNDLINRQEISSTVLLNINRKINEAIGITFVGGQDFNQQKLKQYTQTGTDLVVVGIPHMSNVEAFNPDYEYRSNRRQIGVFGDLKLDYNDFIYLGVTGRNEWSSTLPIQNRSYFYPGVNAAFVFTDAFNITSNVLSYGKLRAGYAKTARDPDPYQVINTFVVPNESIAAGFGDGFVSSDAPLSLPFNGIAGYTASNYINNPNLKAETTKEVEVGAELRFFRDRIGLDFTYFSNKNENGIIQADISPAAGATNLVVNSGLTTVKGIEVGLNVTPIKTTNFNWNAYITFNRIRSKVVDIYPGVQQIYLGGFSGNPAIFAVKGERYGSIIGTGYSKDENGNILVDADGFPLFVDGVNLGHIEPDWTGGIRNSFNYKNFSLDFLLDARQGGYMYNGTEELLDFYGVSKKTEGREDDFIFPGVNETDKTPNSVVVKRDATWWSFAQGNEEYVYENSWVRLREANLSYNLTLNKGMFVKSLLVGVYGRNLWLNTDVPHVDPESSSFGTGNGQGATRMSFPTTRSIGFNIRLTF